MRKEGIDYFETWAPVVMWSTVRIVMVLAAKLNLVSVQCDITAAFIHGKVPATEEIYVHQPRGFNRGRGDEVLRLNGLCMVSNNPRDTFLSTSVNGLSNLDSVLLDTTRVCS